MQEATGKLLSGIRRPLRQALDLLVPHLETIEKDWCALMQTLAIRPSEINALRCLTLPAHAAQLRAEKYSTYQSSLQRQTEELIKRGVPEEHALAALVSQLETCLPYLPAGPSMNGKLERALTRLTLASEIFLSGVYARKQCESQREVETKLRQVEERLRNFSMHLINISEQDRSRLSRDLHDEIGHNLLVLKLYMEMIALDLKEGHTRQVEQKLGEAVDLVGQAIDGVRRLAFDLGPAILDEMGFVPSIRRYSRQYRARTRIRVRVETRRMPSALPSSYEVAFYRVFQGALSNVAAHSKATEVKVTLGTEKDCVYMVVGDDGVGFDLQKKLREPDQAFGLMAMRQRIELLGGTIHAESRMAGPEKPRHGTRIEVRLPLLQIEK